MARPAEKLVLNRLGVSHVKVARKPAPALRPTKRPVRFGYVGRLHPSKGLVELAHAVRAIPAGVDFRLDIRGPMIDEGSRAFAARASGDAGGGCACDDWPGNPGTGCAGAARRARPAAVSVDVVRERPDDCARIDRRRHAHHGEPRRQSRRDRRGRSQRPARGRRKCRGVGARDDRGRHRSRADRSIAGGARCRSRGRWTTSRPTICRSMPRNDSAQSFAATRSIVAARRSGRQTCVTARTSSQPMPPPSSRCGA